MSSSGGSPEQSSLGKQTDYPQRYSPQSLYRIARTRNEHANPQFGHDRWVSYELTWLNESGIPQCAVLEIIVPAHSKFIVESKSLKLYLGSLAFEKFPSAEQVVELIRKDILSLLECDGISVTSRAITDLSQLQISEAPGCSIDSCQTSCLDYSLISDDILQTDHQETNEILSSSSFRSLCPVTSQPDYATVIIEYSGRRIIRESLLRYLVSFRNHRDFHETCCERIFADILKNCKPELLTVACCFNRRGGIEINPVRSNFNSALLKGSIRLSRQ